MTQTIDYPKLPAGAHWGPPTPPPAPKQGWVGKLVLFGVLFVVGLAVAGAALGGSEPGGLSSPAAFSAKTHTVTYLVDGTTTLADITYENAFGDTSQQSDIKVPLTREGDGGKGLVLNNVRDGAFLYISAQNGKGYGSITCSIEVDGVVVKTNTSRGAYTIATCSGRL